MKVLSVLLFVVCVYLVHAEDDCPPGESNPGPGPNCGTEPTCAPRSSHFIPKHTCDCWCNSGTYRNIDTNECVRRC